ncbi:MAG: hypothetical protein KA586_11670 [Candidatus Promineofilum sp.]|nr:hypothetical protein [Promineifilum sp.]
MVRSTSWLIALLILLLASCVPDGAANESALNPPPYPVASPAASSHSGVAQSVILSPLQIDDAHSRLFAAGQVNGKPKLLVLDARTGSLLMAWDEPGQLALDAARQRLIVDRGAQGVALLDASTGETLAVIDLPAQDGPPAPQVDTQSGLIYAFRDTSVFVIDPATGEIIRTIPLTAERFVCDEPSGDAPIYQTAADPSTGRLYLSFITRTCVPWVTMTLIALDPVEGVEVGRVDVDGNSQYIPYEGDLIGLSVNRLGPTTFWRWDSANQWHEESGDFQGSPAGMAIDTRRQLIYEAVGETIRTVEPQSRTLTGEMSVPLLADSRLAGHDAAGDTLYFVTPTGRLMLWPAANLFDQQFPPVAAPSPLPPLAVRQIVPAPNWADNQTMAALMDGDDCAGGGQLFVLINPESGWLRSTTAVDGTCESVAAVAFSPDFRQDSLLVAATNQPPTVMRSLDTGRSWTPAETVFPEGTRFAGLFLSPGYADNQTLFALTTTGLLYRARDGGRNWHLLDQRLDRVALVDGQGLESELYGAYGARILHSTDGGEEWLEVGAAPNGEPLALLATAPSSGEYALLYAFTDGGRFARSLDGGATWQSVMETSPGPPQLAIAVDIAEEQRPIFLLHDRSITASFDGMASVWAAGVADEAGRFQPTAIAIVPDFAAMPYLFAGTADGQIIRVRADAQP